MRRPYSYFALAPLCRQAKDFFRAGHARNPTKSSRNRYRKPEKLDLRIGKLREGEGLEDARQERKW